MHILDLAVADGLTPEKAASTHDGEYHSHCPSCGKTAKFTIYEKNNRYYCSKCQRRGDPLQYLRDFHALSYKEARKQLGKPPGKMPHTQLWRPLPSFIPFNAELPNPKWHQQASNFVTSCQKKLLATPRALNFLFAKGFTLGTMQTFCLGWNPKSLWVPRCTWGLAGHSNKKLLLPKGLVIPTFDPTTQQLVKIKVRREDWAADSLPKHVEISGNMKAPGIYGAPAGKPLVILESELDAMLVQQFAGDICCPIALGSTSKRPDQLCHQLLTAAPLTLFAIDVNKTGATAFGWWRKIYPDIIICPPLAAASPVDVLNVGSNLRRWVLDGIRDHMKD